jgi:hypothetical protein
VAKLLAARLAGVAEVAKRGDQGGPSGKLLVENAKRKTPLGLSPDPVQVTTLFCRARKRGLEVGESRWVDHDDVGEIAAQVGRALDLWVVGQSQALACNARPERGIGADGEDALAA